jgi:hypothetical protein
MGPRDAGQGAALPRIVIYKSKNRQEKHLFSGATAGLAEKASQNVAC